MIVSRCSKFRPWGEEESQRTDKRARQSRGQGERRHKHQHNTTRVQRNERRKGGWARRGEEDKACVLNIYLLNTPVHYRQSMCSYSLYSLLCCLSVQMFWRQARRRIKYLSVEAIDCKIVLSPPTPHPLNIYKSLEKWHPEKLIWLNLVHIQYRGHRKGWRDV